MNPTPQKPGLPLPPKLTPPGSFKRVNPAPPCTEATEAPAQPLPPPAAKPEQGQPEVSAASTGHVAYAICDHCRPRGRCDYQMPSTSPIPGKMEKDPHIHLGRGAIYKLINAKKIIALVVGGKRVLDNRSKCEYLRKGADMPATKRGGNRKKPPESCPAPVEPSSATLTPPSVSNQAPALPGESQSAPICQVPKPFTILPPPATNV